jgi:hypothetical protein
LVGGNPQFAEKLSIWDEKQFDLFRADSDIETACQFCLKLPDCCLS